MATDWITTTDAARLSGYHPERIRELVREGKVKARKFGIVWQVSSESLIAYLKSAKASGDKRQGPKPT
ncbi:hypothetical protein ANRL3_00162 [Anaerolineae bacterium]|nr:hypothetical protein ANRL3_00162 [Anaerolineae bacterium]